MSVVDSAVEWARHNFDIEPDVWKRLVSGETEASPRTAWTAWVPLGILMEWATLSERERAVAVAVGHHCNWHADVA